MLRLFARCPTPHRIIVRSFQIQPFPIQPFSIQSFQIQSRFFSTDSSFDIFASSSDSDSSPTPSTPSTSSQSSQSSEDESSNKADEIIEDYRKKKDDEAITKILLMKNNPDPQSYFRETERYNLKLASAVKNMQPEHAFAILTEMSLVGIEPDNSLPDIINRRLEKIRERLGDDPEIMSQLDTIQDPKTILAYIRSTKSTTLGGIRTDIYLDDEKVKPEKPKALPPVNYIGTFQKEEGEPYASESESESQMDDILYDDPEKPTLEEIRSDPSNLERLKFLQSTPNYAIAQNLFLEIFADESDDLPPEKLKHIFHISALRAFSTSPFNEGFKVDIESLFTEEEKQLDAEIEYFRRIFTGRTTENLTIQDLIQKDGKEEDELEKKGEAKSEEEEVKEVKSEEDEDEESDGESDGEKEDGGGVGFELENRLNTLKEIETQQIDFITGQIDESINEYCKPEDLNPPSPDTIRNIALKIEQAYLENFPVDRFYNLDHIIQSVGQIKHISGGGDVEEFCKKHWIKFQASHDDYSEWKDYVKWRAESGSPIEDEFLEWKAVIKQNHREWSEFTTKRNTQKWVALKPTPEFTRWLNVLASKDPSVQRSPADLYTEWERFQEYKTDSSWKGVNARSVKEDEEKEKDVIAALVAEEDSAGEDSADLAALVVDAVAKRKQEYHAWKEYIAQNSQAAEWSDYVDWIYSPSSRNLREFEI